MLKEINEKFPWLRQKILGPFAININPNIITFLAFIIAISSGLSFFYSLPILGSILILINGFLDMLDGEIAKKYKRQTLKGDFLDHALDRIADVSILLGITLSYGFNQLLGFSLIIITLLVSYLGTTSHALTKERLYSGLIGRSDRLVIIAIAGFLTILIPESIEWAFLLLVILSSITFIQRFFIIYNKLK